MLFKNTTDARRAPIPVKTSPTFSIPRLVYRAHRPLNFLVGDRQFKLTKWLFSRNSDEEDNYLILISVKFLL